MEKKEIKSIETADIYMHFPCITRYESIMLDDFVNENHIECEGATGEVIYLQTQLKKQKEIIDKAVEYIKENVYENENGCGDYWWEITSRDELLSILEDKEV